MSWRTAQLQDRAEKRSQRLVIGSNFVVTVKKSPQKTGFFCNISRHGAYIIYRVKTLFFFLFYERTKKKQLTENQKTLTFVFHFEDWKFLLPPFFCDNLLLFFIPIDIFFLVENILPLQ